MNKPKYPSILIISKNFDVGGTETHIRTLANKLVVQGYKVFVGSNTGRQCKCLHKSVTFVSFNFNFLSFIPNLYKIKKLIDDHNIELIHAHSRRAISFGAIASFLFQAPLVVTVHGRVKYDLRSWFARLKAARVILVNHNTYKDIEDWPLLGKKSIAIANGSDVNKYPHNHSDEKISFAYVSRVNRKHYKALCFLIEIFSSQKIQGAAKLMIIGDGDCFLELKNKILPKYQNINIEGYQSRPADLMNKVDVVIGVGKVAIDGLYSGKAVYTLNGAYRGKLVNDINFTSLRDSNFVNIGDQPPSYAHIKEDIENIITLAKKRELLKSTWISPEKIQLLSINNQISGTTHLYQEVLTAAKNY